MSRFHSIFFTCLVIVLIIAGLYMLRATGALDRMQRESVFEGGAFYTNLTYGFEVQYPDGWQTIEATKRGKERELAFDLLQEGELFRVSIVKDKAHAAIRVYPSDGLSLDAWREAILKKSDEKKSECLKSGSGAFCLSTRDFIREVTKTSFQGRDAYRVRVLNLERDVVECTQVLDRGYVFELCPNNSETARAIISTFAFLEQKESQAQ